MALDDPSWLLAVQAAGLVLLLLTFRTALQAFLLTRAQPLLFFALGFGLVALAQADALALGWTEWKHPDYVADHFDHRDVLFWAYYVPLLAGYVLLFLSFGRHPFRWAPALAPILGPAAPLLQLVIALVLFFVVLHAGFNHIARARPGSFQTALGFFLVLVGQFLFMIDFTYMDPGLAEGGFWAGGLPLTPRTLVGELPSLGGFLLLYLATARPRGTS